MTEQDIYERILDCQDLLDKIHEKEKVVVIKRIIDRYNKYSESNKPINISTINNAVLENKIKNITIQILLLKKINQMNLPSDYQEIYANLPDNIEEMKKYICNLSESLELVTNCHNLIIEMEMLFETEYEVDYEEFKDSEYASIIYYYGNIYEYMVKNNITKLDYANNMINVYINNLTKAQKQALYYESLSLCYNRNVFDYTNILVTCNRINNDKLLVDVKSYQVCRQLITSSILNKLFEEKSLSEIYKILDEVHNSKKVKSLIRKK